MTDDRKTLTLTAPDGWEYRFRPEGGWPDPWDGTEWINPIQLNLKPYNHRPGEIPFILVRTHPPTVTITEAQLREALGPHALGWVGGGAGLGSLFEHLRRITGEGE